MPYSPDRFLDHGIYLRIIDREEAAFQRQLEEERVEDQTVRDRKQFKDVNHQ
jgi:hypothetical protein